MLEDKIGFTEDPEDLSKYLGVEITLVRNADESTTMIASMGDFVCQTCSEHNRVLNIGVLKPSATPGDDSKPIDDDLNTPSARASLANFDGNLKGDQIELKYSLSFSDQFNSFKVLKRKNRAATETLPGKIWTHSRPNHIWQIIKSTTAIRMV